MPEQALLVPEPRVEKSGRQPIQVPLAGDDNALLAVIARAAADPTIDLDKMQKLLEMRERLQAKAAEQAFVSAMAQFKENPPTILKDTHVNYKNKAGTVTDYNHASLAAVCSAIISGLSAVGISHRWLTEQNQGKIKVTCILTHSAGHSERTALESAADDSGGKNAIQAIASAISYLSRYTLLAATGLATEDDDGRASDKKPVACITESQVADLEAMISEVKADKAQFLKYLKIGSLAEMPETGYSMSVKLLEAKRRQVRK